MAAPPYSIVVVTWQCAGFLAELVASMNEHLDGSQELVVVDNDSDDDPRAAAARWKGPGEFIATGENLGFGIGSNLGTERARGPAVVLLNPDTELLDDGLDRLAATALERRALVGPRVLNRDRTKQASASGPEVGAWPWIRAILPGGLTPGPVVERTEPWRLEPGRARVLADRRVRGRPHRCAPQPRPLRSIASHVRRGPRPRPARGGGRDRLDLQPGRGLDRPPRRRLVEPCLRRRRGLEADGRGPVAGGAAAQLRSAYRAPRLARPAAEPRAAGLGQAGVAVERSSDEASRAAIIGATEIPDLPPAPVTLGRP